MIQVIGATRTGERLADTMASPGQSYVPCRVSTICVPSPFSGEYRHSFLVELVLHLTHDLLLATSSFVDDAGEGYGC
jgi:hypothetical protein